MSRILIIISHGYHQEHKLGCHARSEEHTSELQSAQAEHFSFHRVSGLEGFEEALHTLQTCTAFVAVSDIAQGYTELNNTPHTRRVKTVFLAMRHALDDMVARQECMDIMRELFRQFMSVLVQEKVRIEKEHIYLDPRISFQEIDTFFFSGCACAFFQVATDVYTDLRFNIDEWEEDVMSDRFFNDCFTHQYA